jgi:hypothetical protein
VIITTDKTRVSRFVFIPIINRWCFGFISLWIIFILLGLTLSFFGFFFVGGGRLDRVYLGSLVDGRGRRRSILNIRRNGFGVVAIGLDGMRLGMEGANHIVSCMRSNMSG